MAGRPCDRARPRAAARMNCAARMGVLLRRIDEPDARCVQLVDIASVGRMTHEADVQPPRQSGSSKDGGGSLRQAVLIADSPIDARSASAEDGEPAPITAAC